MKIQLNAYRLMRCVKARDDLVKRDIPTWKPHLQVSTTILNANISYRTLSELTVRTLRSMLWRLNRIQTLCVGFRYLPAGPSPPIGFVPKSKIVSTKSSQKQSGTIQSSICCSPLTLSPSSTPVQPKFFACLWP